MRRLLALALGALGIAAVPAAGAELTVTAQARAIDAVWMTSLPPALDVPPICVIDTGADFNPDTRDTIEARRSVVGGDLGDQGGLEGHGTTILQVIGARQNNWGSVGIWPWAKVVSVRAARDTAAPATVFSWSDYTRALFDCRTNFPDATVVSLSLGAPSTTEGDYAEFADYVTKLRNVDNISIVASAGNDGTTEPHYPSSTPGVIGVAGLSAAGDVCATSNRQAGQLAVLGCGVQVAGSDGAIDEVTGTSVAAPQVAAILAALRAYAPNLSRQRAEDILFESSDAGPEGLRRVNARRAFLAAGLGALVPPGGDSADPLESSDDDGTGATGVGAGGPAAGGRNPSRPRVKRVDRSPKGLRIDFKVPKAAKVVVYPAKAAVRIDRDTVLIKAGAVGRVVGVRTLVADRVSRPKVVKVPSRERLIREERAEQRWAAARAKRAKAKARAKARAEAAARSEQRA